jgi:hypothetical protein
VKEKKIGGKMVPSTPKEFIFPSTFQHLLRLFSQRMLPNMKRKVKGNLNFSCMSMKKGKGIDLFSFIFREPNETQGTSLNLTMKQLQIKIQNYLLKLI